MKVHTCNRKNLCVDCDDAECSFMEKKKLIVQNKFVTDQNKRLISAIDAHLLIGLLTL